MVQRIVVNGLKGTGIIAVLFIMGIASKMLGMRIGDVAIGAAIFLGIVFAVLGVVGIISRYV